MDLYLTVLFFSVLIFAALLPFDVLLPWTFDRLKEIDSKLDKKRNYLYFSKAPILVVLEKVLDFLKGFLVPFFAVLYFEDEIILLVSVALVLVAHNWSPFLKFRNRMKLWFILLGIYTFIYSPLFIVYISGYIVLSLLFNSFVIGFISNVIFMFSALWFFQLDPIYMPINFIIFVVVFLSYGTQLFIHFEKERLTILKSFESR
ncbi:MAG: hypothetical protein GY730_02970 [bacterium]|nr:hypothetical protein [bacterium]